MCEILVAFEIENELRRKEFIKKIKSLAACIRILSNVYIVRSSDKTAITIRDSLQIEIIKDTDRLFVVDIEDSSWAANNLPIKVLKWLKY